MQRKKLKLREYCFHIVGKTKDEQPFPVEIQTMWDLLVLRLNYLTLSFGIRVRALVLMENHFHLLISSSLDNCDLACVDLKDGIHHLSGIDFLSDLKIFKIQHPIYFQYAYKYIYRNPVSVGIVHRVENYHFTSLQNVLGKKSETFWIFDNMNLIHDPERVLKWLNEPLPELTDYSFNELYYQSKDGYC